MVSGASRYSTRRRDDYPCAAAEAATQRSESERRLILMEVSEDGERDGSDGSSYAETG